jgi:hypothetical protein
MVLFDGRGDLQAPIADSCDHDWVWSQTVKAWVHKTNFKVADFSLLRPLTDGDKTTATWYEEIEEYATAACCCVTTVVCVCVCRAGQLILKKATGTYYWSDHSLQLTLKYTKYNTDGEEVHV